jgi:hypothetical protein
MKRFTGCVKRLKNDMDALHRRMKHLHNRGDMFFTALQMDGGRMRNLDDAEQWLNDARGALAKFIKSSKGESA